MILAELSPPAPAPVRRPGRISEAEAIDIWIARWLGVPRKDLLRRYQCDPRRLYEIWWEERLVGSRQQAETLFRERYPVLAGHVDFSRRRRIPHAGPDASQLELFEVRASGMASAAVRGARNGGRSGRPNE